MNIEFKENGIYLNILITEEKDVQLHHLSTRPMKKKINSKKGRSYRLVELQESGFDQNDHHGTKHTGCSPSDRMKYKTHRDYYNDIGRKLEIIQEYNNLEVTTHLQFFNDIQVVRSWNEVVNHSEETHPIEYISSFALTGLSEDSPMPRDRDAIIYLPHNTWFGEAQWKRYTPNELGYNVVQNFSMKKIQLTNTGSWACSEFLPMGSYENTSIHKTITWQIETSGSWHWEISDVQDEFYLQISGPTYQDNFFLKNLKPGETFESIPCAVAIVEGGFEKSIEELTKYRRAIRRKSEDNEKLPVIFNDYMNCLMGNPTTEALKPLIKAAKDAGCEYFCIDCGWYDDGPWWDGVGEWLPSKKRFPGGIQEPLNYIRKMGMIPGLWLEIEVMGINCPMSKRVPKDWFFMRNGKPIIDHNRYQLDFRNPEVRDYATNVIKRLVEEYGVGYIKMDYNIDIGVGTDMYADSAGEGLLSHTRAYLEWMDYIFETYPKLVIENCSSGGMRMEYSLLSRHSIQSVTDQEDYIKMAAIAANCMTACTPEQAAIWSYPLRTGDREETIYNMVNAMLMRIHQSGHLGEIDVDRFSYVAEGIAYYKTIRKDIKTGFPFWPIGLASMSDEYVCVGLNCTGKKYLAVWRMTDKGDDGIRIPMDLSSANSVSFGYPKKASDWYTWDKDGLTVTLKPGTARIFEIVL